MTTPSYLAQIATRIETIAGVSSSANATSAGYWKRIAVAAEALAGASTTANATEAGYALRAQKAICTWLSFSSTAYNTTEVGNLAKMVAALSAFEAVFPTGSLERQLLLLLNGYSSGGAPVWDGVNLPTLKDGMGNALPANPIVGQQIFANPAGWTGTVTSHVYTFFFADDNSQVPDAQVGADWFIFGDQDTGRVGGVYVKDLAYNGGIAAAAPKQSANSGTATQIG